MIFPTTACVITPTVGFNDYGKPQPGPRVASLCAIVKLATALKATSIRTDRSASQGNATEIIADARLLFSPYAVLKVGDIVTIRGVKLMTDLIEEKFHAITGALDHLQADFSVWV